VIDDAELQFQSTKSLAVTAKVGVENAKASLNVQVAKVSEAEAAESTARANLETAKLGLVQAQLALARGKILAPFDGVVTRCNGSAGDYVRGGEASREPIVTVMRIDILRVVVGIPERYSALAKKESGRSSLRCMPGFGKAKVARVSVSVDGPTGRFVPRSKSRIHAACSDRG
jgi:multidrug efflux pump subunit AcrA (membrane-fusion protein)